ncbi:MAG: AMP-binding protein [Acidimicrobiia bacterium]
MTTTATRPEASDLSQPSTPALLRAVATASPSKVALREKTLGIWEEVTYADYWNDVKTAAMGLWALGVRPGDRVAIQSENRIAWVVADLAAQSLQGVSVGLYSTNPSAEVEYLLAHSESKVLIAEDQEQVDKALAVKDRLPNLTKIVYVEPRGVVTYGDPLLMSWDDLLELGLERMVESPGLVDELVDGIEPDDLATLVYTSGTTGPPKGVMLSHRNLVWTADRSAEVITGEIFDKNPQFLSYLPLCHVFGRLYDLLAATRLEATVNFAESIDTLVADLVEVQPTYFPAPPRILEKMHASVMIRMADASFMKKLLFKTFLAVGYRNADRVLARGKRGLFGDALYGLGWLAVYRPLKQRLGLRNCKSLVSGSAPIAPAVLKFFMAIGVPIYEAWGMTETTAYGTINERGNIKLGTIGCANDLAEIELAADGEILVRHPAIFMGYFKDPEATAEAVDDEGWLHTGDIAERDGEHFRIIDRKKDIIITAGGKNISPSEIENKLKVSPYIKEAIVIGDRRKYLSALVGIELDTVANWALRRDLTFTTYRDLSEKPEVISLIRKEVDRVNEEFSRVEQIKQFVLLPKELDHEEGELTATQKVKRRVIEELFADHIEGMYA